MNGEWFGRRLKELREKAGLTQKDLADRAGLSQRAVSHWEQGLREPAWSNVVALAEALGVDCRAFLQEPGEAPDPKRGRPPKAQAQGIAFEESRVDNPPKKPRGRKRKEK